MVTKRSPLYWFYAAIISFLVVGYGGYAWLNWSMLLDRHYQRLEALSAQMGETIDRVFKSHLTILEQVGERLRGAGAMETEGPWAAVLEDVMDSHPSVKSLGLARPDGSMVAIAGIESRVDNMLANPRTEALFRQALEDKHIAEGRAHYFSDAGHWAVPIRLPLYDNNAQVAAIVTSVISLRDEDTRWARIKQLPEAATAIVGRDGIVRFSSTAGDSANEPLYTQRLTLTTLAQLEQSSQGEDIRLHDALLCDDCFIAAQALDAAKRQEYVVILYPYQDIYKFFFITMVVPTLLLIVAVLALLIFYRQHTRYERKILRMAQYDSLTGLPNRPFAMDRLTNGIRLAEREGWHLAVLFIDLDNFKQINDAYGHHAGDQLLQQVATRIIDHIKASDTVARLGGDEFFVILPHIKQPANVIPVANRLLQLFQEPIRLPQQDVLVSPSIGLAVYPEDGETPDELLKNADAAMYMAKNGGRNNVVSYSKVLKEQCSRSAAIATHLPKALERKEFYLMYQPQYNLETNTVTGFEALCRWENTELGPVNPLDFIPLAEESGMIVHLGAWVLAEACRARHALEREWGESVRMAVNISVRQVREPGFSAQVRQILKDTNTLPHQIELEITESLLLDQFALDVVRELRSDGYSIAVDDFGTGYAALSYLHKFPVNTLKIDRSFLADFPHDKDSFALVAAIISLAHTFRFDPVAEGIENDAQRESLLLMGCVLGQGFGLCKPKKLEQLLEHPADSKITQLHFGEASNDG